MAEAISGGNGAELTRLPNQFTLSGATIVAGDTLEVIEAGYLVIDSGRVADVGAGPAPNGSEVFSLSGYAVLPAFINAHTHLADSALKEVGHGRGEWELLMPPDGLKHRALRALDRDSLVDAMRRSIRLMLRTGTVAFSDFREQGVAGITMLDEAAHGLPITSVTMGRFAELPPHSEEELRANVASLPEGYVEELEAILAAAPGFSFVTANDTTDAGLRQAAGRVRAKGRRLAVHVAENEQYRELSVLRTGQSDVARAVTNLQPDFVVHMTTANDDELDLVAEAGIPVIVCGRIQASLANGVPPLDEFRKRGIPFALGTDNVMLASPNILEELKYMARVPRALSRDPSLPTPRELLEAVTTTPAKALNLDQGLGALTLGKAASFIVFDLQTDNLYPARDPLASIVNRADTSDIAAVVHHGSVVFGELKARSNVPELPAVPV
ncbi:MAG TPA: amidohydrolase family protein [Rhodothermia bacterium]|nr:amidohydrolase family protein [Rhodothermia bacterium]